MMRRSFTMLLGVGLAILASASPATAQESRPSYESQDDEERYSDQELDNLVGSIALYPDALLAQVLVAATFPDQVEEAARFVRANGTSGIDDQPWDVSVKAVAHYPSALNMMADKSDWTTALGRAYATQSSEVMAAVQRMRRMADSQGNLRSSEQQTISRDDDNYYVIAPTQTRVIYVPVYDPYVIYTRPIFQTTFYSRYWSFGVGFPIGGWLNYDCNWRTRSVYYDGWNVGYFGNAGGWRGRSRPYFNISTVYVHPRYRSVYVNRDVVRRRVIYRNIDRYPGVHRETRFGRRDNGYNGSGYGTSRSGNNDRGRYDAGRSGNTDRGRYDAGRNGSTDRGRYDAGRNGSNDGGRYDVGRSGNSERERYDAGRSGSNDRGRYDATDRNRYPTPDRGRYDGRDSRGDDRRNNGSWNTNRDDRPRSINDGRGGTIGTTDDRGDRGRTIGDNRGGSLGRPDMGDRGRTIGDNRGGTISNGADDRGRDRDRDRGMGSNGDRGSRQRDETPMINPRRAEPQQQRGNGNGNGNDGGRGGQRGGRGNDGRERPKF